MLKARMAMRESCIDREVATGCGNENESRSEGEGTPQGGSISPLLSNIYLHYVLDRWFEIGCKPSFQGEATLIRFADDCAPRRQTG